MITLENIKSNKGIDGHIYQEVVLEKEKLDPLLRDAEHVYRPAFGCPDPDASVESLQKIFRVYDMQGTEGTRLAYAIFVDLPARKKSQTDMSNPAGAATGSYNDPNYPFTGEVGKSNIDYFDAGNIPEVLVSDSGGFDKEEESCVLSLGCRSVSRLLGGE